MAQGLLTYAKADPARVLVSDLEKTYTRAEFNARVNRLIHVLHAEGLKEGDTVAILAGNSADFVTTVAAASLAGMPLVPVNWHWTVDEVAYVLRSSGASAVISDAAHQLTAQQAADDAGLSTVLLFGPAFEERLAQAPTEEPPPTGVASAIYYTAGTTGVPKGTRMAEMNAAVTVEAQIALFNGLGLDEHDVQLAVGPMYHGGPLRQAVGAVMTGAQLYVTPSFDAEQVLSLIEKYHVTSTLLVPTHCIRLLRLPEPVRARYDVSSLRDVYHIGAMMPEDVKRQMIEWWGPILTDMYGCSELGLITRITSEEWLLRPGSVGRPVPWFRVDIIGEDNEELGPGEVGTVYLTAGNDADIEYLDDPAKTAEAHRQPRQFTLHDLGWLDDDGYLYLADRRVDLIISGGVNIYPAEVEGVLVMHPAVEDVGVFAVPDPEWGHAVKAAVTLRPGWDPGPVTEAAILDWGRTRMAHLKVPRSIDFHNELPRFTNGKLHRRALRDPYWATAETGTS